MLSLVGWFIFKFLLKKRKTQGYSSSRSTVPSSVFKTWHFSFVLSHDTGLQALLGDTATFSVPRVFCCSFLLHSIPSSTSPFVSLSPLSDGCMRWVEQKYDCAGVLSNFSYVLALLFDPVMWPAVGVFICFNNSCRTLLVPETSKEVRLPVTLASYDEMILNLSVFMSRN